MISIKSTSYYVKTNFDKIVQTSLYTSVKLGWLEELIVREHFILQKKKREPKEEAHFAVVGIVLCYLQIFTNSGVLEVVFE